MIYKFEGTINVYAIHPIDFWEGWLTLDEVIAKHNETNKWDNEGFKEKFSAAKKAAYTLGWEGDGAESPYISMIPAQGSPYCSYMIAWKQSNNGTTFVACEYYVPWLEDDCIDWSTVTLESHVMTITASRD